jgi:hypothetical protein
MHRICRVVELQVTGPHQLRLTFDDGLVRIVDLTAVLRGTLYGPLRDPVVFATARIDAEVHTVVWPNGADFDPAILHDWPLHAAAFERLARSWEDHGTPSDAASSQGQ